MKTRAILTREQYDQATELTDFVQTVINLHRGTNSSIETIINKNNIQDTLIEARRFLLGSQTRIENDLLDYEFKIKLK